MIFVNTLAMFNEFLTTALFSPSPSTPPLKEDEWKDEPSEVVHLSDSTFDDFIGSNPSVLVMFYAPCKYFSLTCD